MTVKNELTGGCTGRSNAQTVYYVVKTALEKLKKNLTGNTFEARRFLEEVAELTLQNTVGIFSFLFLAELYAILAGFAALVGSMLPGGEVATCQNFVFTENRFAELTGYFGLGTCVSCHCVEIILSG